MPSGSRVTNRGTAPQGRAHHTPWAELPIGQDRVPGGAPEAARAAEVSEPRAPEDTAEDPVLPQGQAQAWKTQGSKDAPADGQPRDVQVHAIRLRGIQTSTDWETSVVTAGADSRDGDMAAATVFWSWCHLEPGTEQGHQGAGASKDKQLPMSRAPGRAWAPPPGSHT